MKKLVLVLIIAIVVATGAFAQFGVGGGLLTDFTEPSGVTLDFSFDIKKISVMWGTQFLLRMDIESAYGQSETSMAFGWGVYAGVAFKVLTVDKWTVYIPLLMDFEIGIRTSSAPNSKTMTDFSIGIMPGIRAKYAFNKNWGLITGFQFDLFRLSKPYTYVGSSTGITFWGPAEALLGFRFTIGK